MGKEPDLQNQIFRQMIPRPMNQVWFKKLQDVLGSDALPTLVQFAAYMRPINETRGLDVDNAYAARCRRKNLERFNKEQMEYLLEGLIKVEGIPAELAPEDELVYMASHSPAQSEEQFR